MKVYRRVPRRTAEEIHLARQWDAVTENGTVALGLTADAAPGTGSTLLTVNVPAFSAHTVHAFPAHSLTGRYIGVRHDYFPPEDETKPGDAMDAGTPAHYADVADRLARMIADLAHLYSDDDTVIDSDSATLTYGDLDTLLELVRASHAVPPTPGVRLPNDRTIYLLSGTDEHGNYVEYEATPKLLHERVAHRNTEAAKEDRPQDWRVWEGTIAWTELTNPTH